MKSASALLALGLAATPAFAQAPGTAPASAAPLSAKQTPRLKPITFSHGGETWRFSPGTSGLIEKIIPAEIESARAGRWIAGYNFKTAQIVYAENLPDPKTGRPIKKTSAEPCDPAAPEIRRLVIAGLNALYNLETLDVSHNAHLFVLRRVMNRPVPPPIQMTGTLEK